MRLLKTLIPQKMYSVLMLLFVQVIGLFTSAFANDTRIGSLQRQVENLNLQFARALEKGDVPAMVKYYATDAVSMPEYHHTLYSPAAIADYYKRWLGVTKDNRCQRSIYSVKIAGEFLLEAGTFTHDFTQAGNSPFRYAGKYIHIWRIGIKDRLTLVSEIWGSATWFDRASLPLSSGTGPMVQVSPVRPGDSVLANNIKNYNMQIAGLVKERNGAAFSAYYTDDAIYMPYYTPMVIGKDSIHSYYVKHEDPAVGIDSVQINMSRMLVAGDFVLVNGFYHVNWRAGGNSGRVTGKSINVWRREKGGKLRLHWQMTNHD